MNKKYFFITGAGLLILALAFVLISFKPAPNSDSGYALMRIYENFAVVNSKIVITYPDNESEIIELGPFKYNDNYLKDNNVTITKTLNDLRSKGFRVINSSSSGKINSNKAMKITNIILEKK